LLDLINTCFSITKTGHLKYCVRKCSLFIAKMTQNTEILLHFSRKIQFRMLLQVINIVLLGFKYLRQRDSSSLLSLLILTCHVRFSDLGDIRFGYIIGLRPHETLVFQHYRIWFVTIFFACLSLFNRRKIKQIQQHRLLFY